MNAPLCSVVMPLFNKEQEVSSTILSVLNQTFKDFELLVINDGSTDCSVQVVKGFTDARLSIINQENSGVSAARNEGIRLSKTELIVFIDADDLWEPDFLATIMALRNDFPQAQWFATGYEIRHPETGRSFSKLGGASKDFYRGILKNYFDVAICSDPPVCSSATAVSRNALYEIGCFPVGVGSGEDLLTWARLAVRYPLAYEARCHAIFRVSDNHRPADASDRVGTALRQLLDDSPSVVALRSYLGLWYRIQAVMAMRFCESALARRRALLSVRYAPLQIRNLYTLILALLPIKWRQFFDKKVRNFFSYKRQKSM